VLETGTTCGLRMLEITGLSLICRDRASLVYSVILWTITAAPSALVPSSVVNVPLIRPSVGGQHRVD